jgi:hypothetical protein
MIEIKQKDTGETLQCLDVDTLAGADLRGANLGRAQLTRVFLTHADLRCARLSSAELRHANLREAKLDGACLVEADLSWAIMADASLRRAELQRAVLEGAFLHGAHLQGANLAGANLRAADLTKAVLRDANLEGANLEGVRSNAETEWPANWQLRAVPAGTRSTDRGRAGFRPALTYRVGRRRLGTIRLWTLQELTLWERLRQCGVLYTNAACVDPDFLPAYQWMREQMSRRLPSYDGHYPWWAWFRPKPDLRAEGFFPHFPPGVRRVRIELAVPKDRVLLSDYSSWHMVLNRSYLALTELEDEAWQSDLNPLEISATQCPLPEPWRSRLVASWERVFDLEALAAGGSWSTGRVQATFERLEFADVVEVTEFTTR